MRLNQVLYMVLFAAILGITGLFAIPVPLLPAPITLQTLVVMLAGTLLGARKGFLTLLFFLLMVTFNLPLLAGGRGGIAALAGPTGGFVLSWPLAAGLIGLMTRNWWKKEKKLSFFQLLVANLVGGVMVVYLIGIPYLAWIADLSLTQAIIAGMISFIPGDLIKVALASYLAMQMNQVNPQLIGKMQA